MNIRSLLKLSISSGILLVLGMITVSWLFTVRLKEFSLAQERARATASEVSNLLVLTHEYALYKEDRSLAQWRICHAKILGLMAEGAESDISASPQAVSDANALEETFQKLVIVNERTTEIGHKQVDLLLVQLLTRARIFSESVNRWADEAFLRRQSAEKVFNILSNLTPVVMFIILAFQAALLFRRVLRPLEKLQLAVQKISQGDLSVRCTTDNEDEFGQFSRTFDAMAVDLVTELRREITERKTALEALLESESRFRQFFETNSSVMLIIEPSSGTIAAANKAASEFYGYSLEQLVGMDLGRINTLPNDLMADDRQRAVRQECNYFNFRHRLASGEERDVEVYSTPYTVGDRSVLLSIVHDITERKQSEIAARIATDRLNEAQRIAHIGNWSLDLVTGELLWSDEVFRLFEVDQNQFGATYEAFLDAIHPDDREAVNRAYRLSLSERRPYEMSHRLLMRDGRIKWVHERGETNFDGDGKPLLSVGTVQDITERKQTEEQLRVAATALESQEGTVIADATGVILRVNQAFAGITGYSVEEVVGQKTNLLKSGLHDDAFYDLMWASINRNGSWKGEIWNRRKNGEVYPEWLNISSVKDAEGNVTHYVGTFSDISQRKDAENQIKELAFYDPLTHLANRRLLIDRLSQALAASIRNEREGALLFIDLDNFKTVNDTYGHDLGDLLLKEVAERLTESFRGADTVARIGGDEFVVVLADLSGDPIEAAAQAEMVGQKILGILSKPYAIAGGAFRSTPSIGVTLFGDQRNSIDELMKQADIAMYQAKAAGRNAVRFFDPELQATVKAHAEFEAELIQGIQRDQLLLYYQPQMDSQGRLIGAEALVRWRHPERGLVSPAQFIPLAEETGLILAIGQWVLETGCRQIVDWASRPEMAHISLAVNVSARQFAQADFVEQVLAVVSRTGVRPERLKLELTESMLAENLPEIIAKMTTLKAHGLSFSLDDFGTGYSSLAYLKRLPLDQLKIDQSFVRDVLTDPNDAAIANTIVALARSLGMGVIAEGVETAEQRDFLARSGCHAYQGYFFSRPLPLEAFAEFVSLAADLPPPIETFSDGR